MAGVRVGRSVAEQNQDEDQDDDISTYDRVVDLINQASLKTKDKEKVAALIKVQELIVNKEPTLLDNFLDEMLAFQSGHGPDVKRFVIGFMEAACRKDPEILLKVVPNLNLMLHEANVAVEKKALLALPSLRKDPEILLKVVPNLNLMLHEANVAVEKKALLALPSLLIVALKWIAEAKTVTDDMEQIWEALNQMKNMSMEMLESDNDGIRTHAVKCMESVVIVLSEKTHESEVPKKNYLPFTIDQLYIKHKFLRVKKLIQNGVKTFDQLMHFQASAHISSINLMTVMGSLSTIAKQRPQFFAKVLQGFETLHVNLPPTLAMSQVSSVRKNLKIQMLQLLRHRCSIDHVSRITTLLNDLGASQTEISKALPKYEERKRKTHDKDKDSADSSSSSATKKLKVEEDEGELEIDEDEIGMTPWAKKENRPSARVRTTAIDITADDIRDKLTTENVADLVLISMVMLPDTQPAQFASIYTPIAAAGTEEQIKHLARLLATQLTMAGMGKGIADVLNETKTKSSDMTPYDTPHETPHAINVLGQPPKAKNTLDIFKMPDLPMGVGTGRRGIKQFKLSNVTQSLSMPESEMMVVAAFNRIIDTDKTKLAGKATTARIKLLATLGAHCGNLLKNCLADYIFDDLKAHTDLAFSWLYQEYANSQGFNSAIDLPHHDKMGSYDNCLTRLLSGMMDMLPDYTQLFTRLILEAPVLTPNAIQYTTNVSRLFTRLILEAPVLTPNAIQIIKKFCLRPENTTQGLGIVELMLKSRPKHRHEHLSIMLEMTTNENLEIRTVALDSVRKIYRDDKFRATIEDYAVTNLRYLLLPKPPDCLFINLKIKSEMWVEEIVRMCLSLYLGLLPCNHTFIHELALVYTAAIADIKRIILRVIEAPVKGMGMHSPELLRFVETCPKGAETLVTRVIHVLTDKADPSPELVTRVKDLYQKRVPDVRFLIPVLTGLSKKEVIAAIPKLIKLNPVVVKEVFHRLLSAHDAESTLTYTSPITPSDLLICLHTIDPTKCDMKTIIKATNLCFQEHGIYTQEILAIVMQQLMEMPTIPTLFMRTVLQTLAMFPRLAGLVLNILQRLIKKKVWEDKKIWEGFIRCCQKTKPQSYAVLLQLPPIQLSSVFDVLPELRGQLLEHVNSFTTMQRSHISSAIMKTLEMNFPPGADPHLDPEPAPPGEETHRGQARATTPVKDEIPNDLSRYTTLHKDDTKISSPHSRSRQVSPPRRDSPRDRRSRSPRARRSRSRDRRGHSPRDRRSRSPRSKTPTRDESRPTQDTRHSKSPQRDIKTSTPIRDAKRGTPPPHDQVIKSPTHDIVRSITPTRDERHSKSRDKSPPPVRESGSQSRQKRPRSPSPPTRRSTRSSINK